MASTTQTTPATTEVIQLHATTHFPIKLTPTNFPIWRRQVHSTLIGLNLHGYVDGSVQEPPKFSGSAPTATNPDYLHWARQDQVIVSPLLESCSDSIRPLVSSASTTYDAWQCLATTYASASQSRARILSLKIELTQNPRGTRSISVFLNDMRSIADALALAQSLVSDEDLVMYILTQLGDEYHSIFSAVCVRQKPISLAELADVLIDHERQLQADDRARQTVLATANITPTTAPLRSFSEYNGPDQIRLGDGNSLHMSHIGHAAIPTPSSALSLENVLHAPQLHKSLISVSQPCKANRVSIELFASQFVVNDLQTGMALLRGPNINGVYHNTLSYEPQMNATHLPSVSEWHHRLGHPSNMVLQLVLQHCTIPVSTAVTPSSPVSTQPGVVPIPTLTPTLPSVSSPARSLSSVADYPQPAPVDVQTHVSTQSGDNGLDIPTGLPSAASSLSPPGCSSSAVPEHSRHTNQSGSLPVTTSGGSQTQNDLRRTTREHRPNPRPLTDHHWQAAKWLLRYLKGTVCHGLFLRAGQPLSLRVFTDSDWGGCTTDSRSTTGYLVYLGDNRISWKSTRRKSVSLSLRSKIGVSDDGSSILRGRVKPICG
ncbi:PREDICTED: uncharacterized protein LOC109152125 [Ipomoea nil]|uniref:uncharacterized protein LOC109152125 n=1 Tax=Ipomoea nil TaxID=35883 RepID=UPI000900B5D3|nr:PREDICTED: uncharacterized protein LOC109152125 [Ipomoea nil]